MTKQKWTVARTQLQKEYTCQSKGTRQGSTCTATTYLAPIRCQDLYLASCTEK